MSNVGKRLTGMKRSTRTSMATYGMVILAYIVIQLIRGLRDGGVGPLLEGQLVPICAYVTMALALNLVVGISGELSLGHAGFMSIGAFAGCSMAMGLESVIPAAPLRLAVAMVFGAAVAAVLGFLLGIPVLRLDGDYLAIVTLAIDLPHAGGGGHRHGPEGLPLVDVADVDLIGGDAHRLQGVQDGVAVVGVGPGVDDDGVVRPVGGVDGVDDGPLVVGLPAVGGGAAGGGVLPDQPAQGLVVLGAVDAGLPLAQQVQVGPVDDQESHVAHSFRYSSAMRSAASSGVSVWEMVYCAYLRYSSIRSV